MTDWTFQDAENHFNAIADAALTGVPQRITHKDKPAVVVLSADEYARLYALQKADPPTLPELLLQMPQDDGEFEWIPLKPRSVEL